MAVENKPRCIDEIRDRLMSQRIIRSLSGVTYTPDDRIVRGAFGKDAEEIRSARLADIEAIEQLKRAADELQELIITQGHNFTTHELYQSMIDDEEITEDIARQTFWNQTDRYHGVVWDANKDNRRLIELSADRNDEGESYYFRLDDENYIVNIEYTVADNQVIPYNQRPYRVNEMTKQDCEIGRYLIQSALSEFARTENI